MQTYLVRFSQCPDEPEKETEEKTFVFLYSGGAAGDILNARAVARIEETLRTFAQPGDHFLIHAIEDLGPAHILVGSEDGIARQATDIKKYRATGEY